MIIVEFSDARSVLEIRPPISGSIKADEIEKENRRIIKISSLALMKVSETNNATILA